MVLIQIDCLFFFIFFFNCFVVSCLQYPETMLRDFPSLMIIQIHPRVPDPNTAKRLIGNMLSLLQEAGMFTKKQMHTHTYYTDQTNSVCNQPLSGFSRLSCLYSAIAFIFNTDLFCISSSGSTGVFCEFRSNDRRMLDFLRTLGLLHLLTVEGLQPGLVIMGTKL